MICSMASLSAVIVGSYPMVTTVFRCSIWCASALRIDFATSLISTDSGLSAWCPKRDRTRTALMSLSIRPTDDFIKSIASGTSFPYVVASCTLSFSLRCGMH